MKFDDEQLKRKLIETTTHLEYTQFLEFFYQALKKQEKMSDLHDFLMQTFRVNTKFSNFLLQCFQLQQHLDIDYVYMQKYLQEFFERNNIKYIINYMIDNQQLSFLLPEKMVAINIHKLYDDKIGYEHGHLKKPYEQYKSCLKNNIRLINIYEPFFWNHKKWGVFENLVLHACGRTPNKVYARDCDIVVMESLKTKSFFIENNIQGYRSAKTSFCLVHKKTKEIMMIYSVGHAHFGKGQYDAEIARGACKLGWAVIGGASKLWKFIINYYKDKNLDGAPGSVDSIVYYVDLNYYNGQSLKMLEGQEFIMDQPGFWNFWVETKELKNREPHRHKFIMETQAKGLLFPVPNAGTQTNVWFRNLDDPVRMELLKRHKK